MVVNPYAISNENVDFEAGDYFHATGTGEVIGSLSTGDSVMLFSAAYDDLVGSDCPNGTLFILDN